MDIFCVGLFCAGGLSALYLCYRWNYRRFYELANKIPGPKSLPILGNLFMFLLKNDMEKFMLLSNLTKEYGSPYKCWGGESLLIVVDEPEDLKILLNSPDSLEKPYVYGFFDIDHGLFSSVVEIWKPHRKLLNPTFNTFVIQSYLPIFNEKSNTLIKKLEQELGQGQFDIFEYTARYNLEAICSTALGVETNLQNQIEFPFLEGLKVFYNSLNYRIFRIWLHPNFIYQRTKLYKDEVIAREKCFGFCAKVIEQRRLELDNDEKQKVEQTDSNGNFIKPRTFIDQMLKLAETSDIIDDRMIKHQTDTMIFAAAESNSLTLSHTLLMLAMHPDVQEKVVQEICEFLPTKNEPVDFSTLAKLKYTEMAIKEAMRLFPVGAIMGRRTTAEMKLTKTTLPKDANVGILIYNVQRNPKYWGPKANKYDPDNFLPEKIANRHPYTYIPFASGPRNCIGLKYAMASVTIALTHLLRHYKFSTKLRMEDLKVKVMITMQLTNKHLVQVERREY